jgi:hypothetical protein
LSIAFKLLIPGAGIEFGEPLAESVQLVMRKMGNCLLDFVDSHTLLLTLPREYGTFEKAIPESKISRFWTFKADAPQCLETLDSADPELRCTLGLSKNNKWRRLGSRKGVGP